MTQQGDALCMVRCDLVTHGSLFGLIQTKTLLTGCNIVYRSINTTSNYCNQIQYIFKQQYVHDHLSRMHHNSQKHPAKK